ncbi:MAG: aspartate/tyrosine/aromatic aminotransferase [Rhizobiales bacterium PAR1]|nr:MAG: aspartate/tyrosine/aromatic aminotransferase [Rhizobiales bacterium PAR1]
MSTLSFRLNPRVLAVDSPPIPEAQGWKAAYDGRHGPMIDLSQAVPGTPPPQEMLARLAEAAGQGDATRYGPILGDGLLREAYSAEISRFYGAPIPESAIAITAGCNEAFVVTMMALAGAGDTVILPTPWYFNHKMTLDMLGISARALPCDPAKGFVPEVEEAEKLIDGTVRAIVLVSPNNPTGAIYPAATIEAFAAMAKRRGIALVLDETYRDFLPATHGCPHALFTDPEWGSTLIQLYSFSKAYAIPGHRLGALVAAPEVIGEIAKILDSVQICPARPAQRVVAWAIEGLRDWRESQRAELQARAAACNAAFAPLKGWRLDSVGAYFAYAAHPWPDQKAGDVARRLATEFGILGLPGPYFGPGQDTHLRLAFANVGADVLAGVTGRLKKA